MKLDKVFSAAVIVLTLAVLVPDASAQLGGMGGAFGGARGGRTRGGDSQTGNRENRNERPAVALEANSYEQIDYRLSVLQEDLKLTAEQSAAWQSFAGKARAYVSDLAREASRGTVSISANTPQASGLQHIGLAVDIARNRLAALEEVETSAKALYQILVPAQKTLVDMRIPAIIAPRPAGGGVNAGGGNLPDLGSSRPY